MGLFFVANRLETLSDRRLLPLGVTLKQWQLSVVLEQHKGEDLSLSRLSALLGTSRQNVKQLALQLQRKGFCSIRPDGVDRRAMAVRLEPSAEEFWKGLDEENLAFLERIFGGIDDGVLEAAASMLLSLYGNSDEGSKGERESEEG